MKVTMMTAVMNTKLDVVTYLINIMINSNKVNMLYILLYKIINVIIVDIHYVSIVFVLLNNTFYKINK